MKEIITWLSYRELEQLEQLVQERQQEMISNWEYQQEMYWDVKYSLDTHFWDISSMLWTLTINK